MRNFTKQGSTTKLRNLVKVCTLLLSTIFLQASALYAHTVDYFASCGYVCSGSTLTVSARVNYVNSSSKYNWQFRDNTGTWKCFVNGNNTINGVVFSVSGVSATGVLTYSPTLTIPNAKTALENVEVRLLIADAGTPCATNPAYSVWGGDKLLRLHVLTGADCSTIATLCSTGGCTGNMLYDASGYYAGFENKVIAPAASDYTLASSAITCGYYKIVNTATVMQSAYPRFAPHSGNYMMYVEGATVASKRVWYKSVAVVAGTVYQFSGWIANANTTANQKASVTLKVNGTALAGATATVTGTAGNWVYVSGSYLAATTGTVELQIYDNNVSCADNDFVLDDICFKSNGTAAAKLGDLVWNDIDSDGRKDSNEPIVAGATVKLYKDVNGDNLVDGAAVATTTTSATGIYSFSNLTAGKYIVGAMLPTGYVRGPVIASGSTPDNNVDNDNNGVNLIGLNQAGGEVRSNFITLTTGNNYTLDVALCGNSSIGDFVWNDVNANGIQDLTEAGISGAIVTITYPDGTIGTTTTNSSGIYAFNALAPGTHKITFRTPAGYSATLSNVGTDDAKDSDPVAGIVNVAVTAGSNNKTIDAGFTSSTTTGCPGNLLGSGPGYFGGFEAGPDNISATTAGSDLSYGLPRNGSYEIVQSVDELGGGGYLDISPRTGNYFLAAHTSNTLMRRIWYTKVNVTPGTTYNFCAAVTLLKNLGNGANFLVGMYVNGTSIATGRVTFDWTQMCGSYTVPAGVTSIEISLRDIKKGLFFLATDDICFTPVVPTGSIGDYVWSDVNKNGIQEANEVGIENAMVTLKLPDNTTRTTLTDASGKYRFSALSAGTYSVEFQTPAGMAASPANQGADDTKDSDPVLGSATVILGANQTNTTVDAGFYRVQCVPSATDTDGDCIPDGDDIDDDNDGILDVVESGGYDPLKDCDSDGVVNYKDATPGCAVPAGTDLYGKPFTPIVWTDCNADGVNDYFDWDRDGIINELDLDSDNDGILDVQETRDEKAVDNNHDGMVDGVDADGDGLLSTADFDDNVYGGPGLTPEDLDRDGTPNYLDLDSDGDGLSDITEAQSYFDADGLTDGTDSDKDGVRTITYSNNTTSADNYLGFGAKGIFQADNDNDGITNPYDVDSDNDGITDNVEGQPTCSEKQPTGNDADSDGIDDAYDTNNNSCVKKGPGITPYDKDGDGRPDIYDEDTDNDNAPDINEGSGIEGNFVPDFDDTDGDGLIDAFDIFDIKTATELFQNNVVHSNMGPNGNFHGPVPGGSNAELPQSAPGECPTADRDWRNVSILPVTMVDFKGNLNSNVVKLSWTVANEINMDHYTVERSFNGTDFTIVSDVKATGNGTVVNTYTLNDMVGNVTSGNVYYRIREVEKSGATKMSNVLVFRLSTKAANALALNPNPASNYFIMKINAVKDAVASIRVADMMGRVVLSQNNRLAAGSNSITFNNLSTFASGTYNVQVMIDGEVLNHKLLIVK